MPNITKNDLTVAISAHTGISRADTKKVLDSLIAVIGDHLANRDTIEIRGFGTFSVRPRKQRPVRNPRTGEALMLESCDIPAFRFSDDIKEQVAQSR